jgi:protein phosphatase
MTAPFRLRYSALSDVGRVRKDNQDSGYAGPHLLAIADGVGGAAYGDVASTTAIHIVRRLDDPAVVASADEEELSQVLAGAVHRVHDKLAELVEHDLELSGTSTTFTAGLFDGSRLYLAHVGDSRAYLLRKGSLRQLTVDHTFVQSLIDDGRITADEARFHPHRNLILRAVDGVHEADPDLFTVDVEVGDRLLFCSDGCSGALDETLIAALLGAGSVDYAAVELVRSSLDHGSTDNVTVVIADIAPSDTEDATETTAATSIGPMLVGAAAHQPRRAGLATRIGFFRHKPEDTGDLDPVGVEIPPDLEILRYAPRPPMRRTWLRRLVGFLLIVLVLGGALTAGYDWTQRQYYVAPDGPFVAIHRGVPFDLPGITLSSPKEVSDVRVDELPEYNADQVSEGISATDLADAREIVDRLVQIACQEAAAAPTGTDKSGKPLPPVLPDYCDGVSL